MRTENPKSLREVFDAALDLPEGERESYVRTYCGDDSEFCAEALAMLRVDQDSQTMMELSLDRFAEQLFPPGDDPYRDYKFRDYQFLERLAIGGMSWVYLAQHLDHGGKVAIKILYDRISEDRLLRFQKEKRSLADLNHPSVTQIYDAGVLPDGAAFLVMEYVEGLPLSEYCRENRVSLLDRLEIFHQVCAAVAYLQSRGMVHCDLKPENILVKEGGIVKIIDLGISERDDDPLELPASASYMTLAYAAPEQIRGESPSMQSDIYALGVLLYQLVTGKLPIEMGNRTREEFKQAILFEVPPKPSLASQQMMAAGQSNLENVDTDIQPGLNHDDLDKLDWGDIDFICENALAKEPSGRYALAQDLIRDLDNRKRKRPLDRRGGRSYRIARFLQRNRVPVMITAGAVLLIAIVATVAAVRLKHSIDRERAEATRTRRVAAFLQTILTGGDQNNGPSAGLTVAEVLNRATHDVQMIQGDPAFQAALNETLGSIYSQTGNFPAAESLLQTARKEKASIYPPDSPDMAETWRNLASLRLNEGKFDEAKELAIRALAIDQKALSEAAPQSAEISILFGEILNQSGDYAAAVPVLEKVVKYETTKDDRPYDRSAALSNLSNSYYYLGRFDDAEKFLLRSMDIDRQIKGENSLDVASDLMSLGTLYTRIDRLPQAENAERKALAINQKWFANQDRPETAASMVILADTLNGEGKNPEALRMATDGLAMYINLKQAPSTGYAHAWNSVGLIQEDLGNHAAAAESFAKSIAIYRNVLASPNYQIGRVLDNMAVNSGFLQQYAAAEGYSREAIGMLKATLPADDAGRVAAEVHFAEILYADHRPDEAEAQLQAARSALLPDQPSRKSELDYVNAELSSLARNRSAKPGSASPGNAPVQPKAQDRESGAR